MKRRALLIAGGAWLAGATGIARAQAAKLRRIAFLHPSTQSSVQSNFDAFRATLKERGYVEGKDISIEVRWGEGRMERLDSLAAELVALKPAVILTGSSAGVAACKKATSTIPIVFTTAANVVEQGFVASLRRPGGNVTGIALYAGLNQKIVEFTREALPAARRLALLLHDQDPFHKAVLEDFEPGARRLGFEPIIVRISRENELDSAFKEFAQRKADALIVPSLTFLNSLRQQLAERARRARLPLLSTLDGFADVGGWLIYGTASEENWRRAAVLVDKILRGAKPGEIPVEQPDRFQLIVNMKTAKAIGVTPSKATLQRADKVIE